LSIISSLSATYRRCESDYLPWFGLGFAVSGLGLDVAFFGFGFGLCGLVNTSGLLKQSKYAR